MMTIKFAVLAASLMTVGVAHAGTPPVTLQQATPEASAKSTEKRYCVRTTISGSRMPQKVCRTRKAWMAEGFDPLTPKS